MHASVVCLCIGSDVSHTKLLTSLLMCGLAQLHALASANKEGSPPIVIEDVTAGWDLHTAILAVPGSLLTPTRRG